MHAPLDRFRFLSPEATDNPYLSFPVAVEAGVLPDPEGIAQPLDCPAGVTLANGFIPNAHFAGLVNVGEEIIAYDLTTLDLSEGQVRITPAPKSAVESSGQISGEGVIVLQNQTGLLRIAALAIDSTRRPWLADRLRGPRSTRRIDEGILVISAKSLDFPDLEIAEIDLDTNSILTTIRTKLY